MRKALFLALSFCIMIVSCTSSNEVDTPLSDEDIAPEVETLVFNDLILTDEYKTLSTVAQIEKAIDQIADGGIIQFGAQEYEIPIDIDITKGVILQGMGTTPNPDSAATSSVKDIAGAGEINTTFRLSGSASFFIYSDNVKFRHVKIIGLDLESGTTGSIEFIGTINNFETENVHFDGGSYMLSPRKGMSHSLKCQYTTFDKSKHRAFFINRKDESIEGMSITKLDKCEFYRCSFSVYDPTTSDTRAISLDAGNNENPNILDFDGLEIRECYFHDIGFASSKCQNFNIIDCEFYVEDLFDFPIHMEEYTCNALVSGCTFICDNSEEVMIGAFDNSVIENNTVIGSCTGFIQGRYAEGLTIKNNNLSQMVNSSSTRAISLWDGVAVGNRNITIENNSFFSNATISIVVMEEYEDTIVMSSNSGGILSLTIKDGYAYPLEDGVVCRLKNNETGEYIKAQGSDTTVTKSTIADEACNWRVTQVWPNRYNIKNELYDTYLYIEYTTDGYSTSALAEAANITPETKSYNSGRLPIWDLTTQNNGCNIIGPGGGNDGCISIKDGFLKQLKIDDRKSYAVSDAQSLWCFEIVE